MKQAHTPGPWNLHGEHMTRYIHGQGENIAGVVAVVNVAWPSDAQQAEQIANAHLIAAAPELLAALVALLEYPSGQYSESDGFDSACDAARSAIAKATEVPL